MDYAVEMTKQMQLFTTPEEVREILKHQYVVEKLDKERVQEMLKLVAKAENTAVIIRSKSFEADGSCTQEDTHYGTKFSKQPYTDAIKEAMEHPEKLVAKHNLGLPPVNTLLPKSLEIKPKDPEYSEVPKLIKEYEGDTEVWYLKDDKFERPKAIVTLKVYPAKGLLSELGVTAEGRMLTEFWVAAVKEHLREFRYMAEMASLELEFTVCHDAVVLEYSGFNDSLPTFISSALSMISSLPSSPSLP